MSHRWSNRLNHTRTSNELVPKRKHRISRGPLAGLEGVIVLQRSPARIVLESDSQPGVYVEIDQSQVELIERKRDE